MFSRIAAIVVSLVLSCAPLQAQSLRLSKMADGFDVPWSLGFLPDGSFLVTERDGRLHHVALNGAKRRINGLPQISAVGQGGLLDIVPARDFVTNQIVFFSYVTEVPGGWGTALSRAKLDLKAGTLVDHKQLFKLPRGNRNGRHFGGRIVEARDGKVFLTIGDMGERRMAQNLRSLYGKVIRLNRDGSLPRDNPYFRYQNARKEIWTLGHRNPQGATLGAGGALWTSEHGAKGGDEVNRIEQGSNYGWPVISYGTHYNGRKIGEGSEKRGMEQPRFYWDPSIAPSGIVVYSGKMFPEWRGDLFVGSLKFDHIAQVSGKTWLQVQQIEFPETGRVRDVRQAPDGALWFLSETEGAVYRIWR